MGLDHLSVRMLSMCYFGLSVCDNFGIPRNTFLKSPWRSRTKDKSVKDRRNLITDFFGGPGQRVGCRTPLEKNRTGKVRAVILLI